MSLTSEFPSDEIKHKFRPYDEYDLKRIIRIYYKWVRSCSCTSSRWSDWDDCEFCFRLQHAKRELVYGNYKIQVKVHLQIFIVNFTRFLK